VCQTLVQLAVEYHKRFDPIYSDARNRARQLGPFSYYYSYMAQPKQQLDTFRWGLYVGCVQIRYVLYCKLFVCPMAPCSYHQQQPPLLALFMPHRCTYLVLFS
jgi:hypothetical protein